MLYAKLNSLAEKAKSEKKGIYNEKYPTLQSYENFTLTINKK
jgi:hypothetical protein